jgi:WD40 repeat protein
MAIRLCETATGKSLGFLEVEDLRPLNLGTVNLAFSPDGKTLAVKGVGFGPKDVVYLNDPETGKVLRRLRDVRVGGFKRLGFYSGGAPGHRVAFSPDGKWVATAGSETIRLWETATGKERLRESGHCGAVIALTLAPGSGLPASVGTDDMVRLWDPATKKERSRFPLPEETTCAALSPDGRLAALGNADGSVRLHETATGKELHKLPGHPYGVAVVAFSPDGKVLASRGTSDDRIRLYEAASGKHLRPIAVFPAQDADRPGAPAKGPFPFYPSEVALWLSFSADGKTVASPAVEFKDAQVPGGGGTIVAVNLNLWDAATGRLTRCIALSPPLGFDNGVLSPDGRMLAVENPHGTVSLWEAATGRERARLGTVARKFALDGEEIKRFLPRRGIWEWNTPNLAFAPDGRTLAAHGPEGAIRLWDVRAAKESGSLQGHEGNVTALAFAPDGKTLASGGSDTAILLWDLAGQVPPKPAVELQARDVEARWADLAGDDAGKAWQAIQELAGSPKAALALFRERLRPAVPADAKKLAEWIAGLDSTEFAVREQAARELEKLGELAVPALKEMLAKPPSLEARTRAERLVEQAMGPTLSGDRLRLVRAVEVLEQVGNAEARRVLEGLAKGAAGALATREAQSALERLAGHSR